MRPRVVAAAGGAIALVVALGACSKNTGEGTTVDTDRQQTGVIATDPKDSQGPAAEVAGASKGGTFLKFFIDPKYPWVHCDIAGTAYHRKDVNYHPVKYGAGVMVRLMTRLLEDWETLK